MPIGINLLPWRTYQQQRQRRQHRQRLVVAVLTGFCLSTLAWLPLNTLHNRQQQANAAFESQAVALADARKTYQQLNQKIEQLAQYHSQQKTIAAARDAWLDALAAVVQADGDNTRLTRIEQAEERWRIAGLINNTASLPAVLEHLKGHGRLTDVAVEFVEPPNQADDQSVRFAITQTARMP